MGLRPRIDAGFGGRPCALRKQLRNELVHTALLLSSATTLARIQIQGWRDNRFISSKMIRVALWRV